MEVLILLSFGLYIQTRGSIIEIKYCFFLHAWNFQILIC
eukprot:UN03039